MTHKPSEAQKSFLAGAIRTPRVIHRHQEAEREAELVREREAFHAAQRAYVRAKYGLDDSAPGSRKQRGAER